MQLLPVRTPQVTIYAEESCLGTETVGGPRPGACSGIVEILGHRFTYAHRERNTTRDRMAIHSALLPLRFIPKYIPVRFVTTSQYLIDGATTWLPDWLRNGWRSASGIVQNRDLWEALADELDHRSIEFVSARGHGGHPESEAAHRRTVEAATEQRNHNQLAEPHVATMLASLTSSPRAAAPIPSPHQEVIERCRFALQQMLPHISRADPVGQALRNTFAVGFLVGQGIPESEARAIADAL